MMARDMENASDETINAKKVVYRSEKYHLYSEDQQYIAVPGGTQGQHLGSNGVKLGHENKTIIAGQTRDVPACVLMGHSVVFS
jgi:hypothetical protein